MTKFETGKSAILVLITAFLLVTFLAFKNTSSVLATNTEVYNKTFPNCGTQGVVFSGYFNEPNEDNSGTNREQFRLRVTLDGNEIYIKDSEGEWTAPSQTVNPGAHSVVAQIQHRESSNSGSSWSAWSNDGNPSDTDNFTILSCGTPSPTPTATAEGKIDWCHTEPNGNSQTLNLPPSALQNAGHMDASGNPLHAGDHAGACATPTATATATATSTATSQPTINPCALLDIQDGCATSTPTAIPSETATATPTPVSTPGLTEAGPPHRDSETSGGQVLGASTMAGTGSFAETLYQAIMGLGGILSFKGLKKLKVSKKK